MSTKSNMNFLKKMNAIAYPKLRPHERFKKFIKAYADNDSGQCKKLVDSCPKYTYIESDNTYTERIQASSDIVSIFLLQLLEYDKVIAVAKILGLITSKEELEELKNPKLSEIYGFLLAFEEFCTDTIGIDPGIMIKAWYGYDDRYIRIIIKIKDYMMINHVEPDKEVKRKWLENVFNTTWGLRVKG
ncbi:hypothetical protein [Priestia aryabhattai]|uniref:hypothetical protein n=1 Tax=Priestia aryabhattai TaxID=412384 RepID=UPI003CFAF218